VNTYRFRQKKRDCYAQPQGSFFLSVFLPSYKRAYTVIDQTTKGQRSAPLNRQMNPSKSAIPYYGNHQHQYLPPLHNQTPAMLECNHINNQWSTPRRNTKYVTHNQTIYIHPMTHNSHPSTINTRIPTGRPVHALVDLPNWRTHLQ
jgi:hypothetical protein